MSKLIKEIPVISCDKCGRTVTLLENESWGQVRYYCESYWGWTKEISTTGTGFFPWTLDFCKDCTEDRQGL